MVCLEFLDWKGSDKEEMLVPRRLLVVAVAADEVVDGAKSFKRQI